MVDWVDHGVILNQKDVPWVNSESYTMWAPDCVEKDGKYYFYFPAAPKGEGMRGFSVGVATADKPEGPFTPEAKPIEGVSGIDPCVLVDDDGEAYIYWAGMGIRGAKLGDDMKSLSSESKVMEGLPEGFKEGPYVFKRDGKYYLTFPWVRDVTETLAYAMSDNPLGPFEFKGVFMEESPTDCWTNHHSITQVGDQWYLFYHHNDYSPDFDKNRSVRIDSLKFGPDGAIKPVKRTLRGVGLTDARCKIQIDRYSSVSPYGVCIDYLNPANPFDGWYALFLRKDMRLDYSKVDFGTTAPRRVKARVKACKPGELSISTTCGNVQEIGRIAVAPSDDWTEVTADLQVFPAGVQDIRVVSTADSPVAVDWITFE